ncbi:helix-turn-helix domain-containing protein [Caproiciproducens sp. R2]|uniref:helix-turn-helix domain-containing protein n=1 Tax=Caproiciproducens sp. R2 TaxID=3435187 RepID=UPI00403338E4
MEKERYRQLLVSLEKDAKTEILENGAAVEIRSCYDCARGKMDPLLKQELGQTFIGYLTQVRMQEAIKLAGVTRLSIKEIAERTGYSNPTYFCRVFKKFTGQTIGGYRESNTE